MCFLLIFHWNSIGRWSHSIIICRLIEYPKWVCNTHEYESESHESDYEDRPTGSEIFLRPIELARPTVDDLSVPESPESHRDSEHCIEDFHDNHNVFSSNINPHRLYRFSPEVQEEKIKSPIQKSEKGDFM